MIPTGDPANPDGHLWDEARKAHAELNPEDNIEIMMVVGWEPITKEEWAPNYCASKVQG